MTRRRVLPLVAAAFLLGGCGFGPGAAKPAATELRVTRDFGQRELGLPAQRDSVRPSDTVMRFLTGEHTITTKYGGGFVQSIDGLEGNKSGEHDWFYYVNGSEASVGAADYKLHSADVVQWDYHRWTATMHVPAIVGAFPEPFVHGLEGRRLPTRVECTDPDAKACDATLKALDRQHIIATSAPIGSASGENSLRVVVGPWAKVRGSITARTIEEGPATSGVYANFSPTGDLTFLDGAGKPARSAPAGTGLIAATQRAGEGPVWLVTGNDDAGVERAAATLTPARLTNAFAVAATPSGPVRLPVGEF